MELQNIRVEFTTEKIMSRYQDNTYIIDWAVVPNMATLKTEFETAFSLTIEDAVVQLTADQYGYDAEPRVWTKHGEDEFNLTNLTTIETEQPTLYAELQAARLLIEAEITAQIG